MQAQEQRSKLVAEVAGFLEAWQERLSLQAAPDAHLASQRSQADLLCARAAELGIGSLVHHLSRFSCCLGKVPLAVPELRESLRAISEITWQLREEWRASAELLAAQSLMAPPLLSLPSSSALQAPPGASVVPHVVSSHHEPQRGSSRLLATLFGLRAFGRSPANVAPKDAPRLVTRRGALPSLAGALPQAFSDLAAVNADLDERLRRIRRGAPRPRNRTSSDANSAGARRSAHRLAVARWSAVSWVLVLVLMVLGGVLLGKGFLALDRRLQPAARAPEAPSLASEPAPGAVDVRPSASPAPATQQFQELVLQVHGSGEESPELAALLDAEANATLQALSQRCDPGGTCEGQRQAQDLLTPRAVARREPHAAGGLPPRWLAGLKLPAIGAHNDPEVQRWVEYYTSHSVGRELFQTMLFRCGAHQDLIEKTLVHYGLPEDLLAVVLTESGCVPNAESAVGARGLWQFMAPTARAYHLHVQEGVVDERLSPVKATEAAVKYLSDLYHKMGSWEMALASYNAGTGPFRMLARLRQAGASATFWDLAEGQLIPEETARYVPRIQAYAVILSNLRHFDFSTAQLRASEETADLEVPARARLGQVARATGTSVAYLRSLNPDLVGTVVPLLPDERFVLQVPKATAHRAREMLGQFLLEQLDLCVPSAFDWGRERFTVEMQNRCAARRRK